MIDIGSLQNPMSEIVAGLAHEFSNNKAIDSDDTDSNPKRVTVEFRFSTVNAGDVAGQPWLDYNWNADVTQDSSGRSNGDPAYVLAEATAQDGQWIQFRVTFDATH